MVLLVVSHLFYSIEHDRAILVAGHRLTGDGQFAALECGEEGFETFQVLWVNQEAEAIFSSD